MNRDRSGPGPRLTTDPGLREGVDARGLDRGESFYEASEEAPPSGRHRDRDLASAMV